MEPIIQVKNLEVIYQPGTPSEIQALKGVSVDINPEEFVIIFGPSGCGKSTLLYSISGVEQDIHGGEILFKGKDVRKMNKDEFILYHRNSAGLIFQNHNLIPTLNVISNVTLPLIFQGVGPIERHDRGMEILKRFGIESIAKKLPSQLSGGQQQRAGIARALINNPEIVLADEPTGNLDSTAALNALNLLKELKEKYHKTVILVTHEAQYLPYADRVIFMKDGMVADAPEKFAKGGAKGMGAGAGEGDLDELKVHARVPQIIDYLGFNTNADQYERLGVLIKDFLLKRIDKEELFKQMHKPLRRGGLSIFKQKAERMIIELSEIREYAQIWGNALGDDAASKIKLEYLVDWLTAEHKHATEEQKANVATLIKALVKGDFGEAAFKEKLASPIASKGAGLNLNDAKKISAKLYLII